MDPDAFAALTEKIWGEVQPLYRQLHCYVRTKLNEKYGDAVRKDRPDPRRPSGQHVGAGMGRHL
jgi:hypothetical protein